MIQLGRGRLVGFAELPGAMSRSETLSKRQLDVSLPRRRKVMSVVIFDPQKEGQLGAMLGMTFATVVLVQRVLTRDFPGVRE